MHWRSMFARWADKRPARNSGLDPGIADSKTQILSGI